MNRDRDINIKYRLQQYEDGTFGYYLIDGDENYNYETESKVICMQGKDEDRDEFITKSGITFRRKQYGSNLKLDMDINSVEWKVRKAVAKKGYGLDKLVNDKESGIREAVAKCGYGLDKLVNDPWYNVRAEVASKGYGLEKLVNDEHWHVRRVVARQGYGLDKLVNDKSNEVRLEVAKQGYGLDILINDEDYGIRIAVANQGYGLDILIKDKDPYVRAAVARKGYGLDKLINDKNSWWVSDVVADYLNSKADDDFIIDLGNKLLDNGYKLSTNSIEDIFTDETCTKFRKFHGCGPNRNGVIYQVLARLLWKNIRIKEIYDPKYSVIIKIFLRQRGLLED